MKLVSWCRRITQEKRQNCRAPQDLTRFMIHSLSGLQDLRLQAAQKGKNKPKSAQ